MNTNAIESCCILAFLTVVIAMCFMRNDEADGYQQAKRLCKEVDFTDETIAFAY